MLISFFYIATLWEWTSSLFLLVQLSHDNKQLTKRHTRSKYWLYQLQYIQKWATNNELAYWLYLYHYRKRINFRNHLFGVRRLLSKVKLYSLDFVKGDSMVSLVCILLIRKKKVFLLRLCLCIHRSHFVYKIWRLNSSSQCIANPLVNSFKIRI